MRILLWILRISLFLVLFGFALKNTDAVVLRYYFGYEWSAPLALMLFAFFAAGAGIGVAACLPAIIRQKREIASLNSKAQQ